MKNMTKTIALLLAGLAAGNSAQAQTQYVAPGKPYTFTATEATSGGTISYQWYRDNEPISGATSQSYTLPENLAYGRNVVFTRSAVNDICPYNTSYTDPFIVTFCDLLVGTTCWATSNLAAANKFARQPDMYTPFFQWNRLTAWATTGSVSGWNSTADQSSTWTVNPCPSGWRLPTSTEFQALDNASSTWVEANSIRGNAVAGRFYGPRSGSCALPDDMVDCVFLPAGGARGSITGALDEQSINGYYWSSTQYIATSGYSLLLSSSSSSPSYYSNKASARSVRCVQ